MLKSPRKEERFIRLIFTQTFNWMDTRDAENIFDEVKDEIIEDIEETADPKEWNDNDVQIAIKRVLMKRLGIEE